MRVHPKVLETEIRAADQGMVWYNNIVDHHLFLMLKIELDPNLGTIKKVSDETQIKSHDATTKTTHFVQESVCLKTKPNNPSIWFNAEIGRTIFETISA